MVCKALLRRQEQGLHVPGKDRGRQGIWCVQGLRWNLPVVSEDPQAGQCDLSAEGGESGRKWGAVEAVRQTVRQITVQELRQIIRRVVSRRGTRSDLHA